MVSPTVRRGRPASKPRSEFGEYLLEIMRSRGLGGGTSGIARAVSDDYEGGYTISQQAVHRVISGGGKASHKFARQFADKLNLTHEERVRLAWLFLFGQGD